MQKKQTTSIHHSRANRTGFKASSLTRVPLEERLLSVIEVARILHVSRSLLYRLIQHGDLPSLRFRRVVRIRQDEFRRYLDKQATSKKPPS